VAAALWLDPFGPSLEPVQETKTGGPAVSTFVAPLPVLVDALARPNLRGRTAEDRLIREALPVFRDRAQDGQREYLQKWFGAPLLQYPNDLLTYQTMIWAQRPEVIIETGTYRGGQTGSSGWRSGSRSSTAAARQRKPSNRYRP